jgi:hypothetical protein
MKNSKAKTIKEQIDIIKQDLAEGKILTIKGYINSKGQNNNYIVKYAGEDGYLKLVKKSRDMLLRLENNIHLKPEHISDGDWSAACMEQLSSFQKTLDGDQPKREYKPNPEKDNDPNFASIPNLVLINKTSNGDEQPEKKKNYRSHKTEAKDILRKELPVGSYLGQMTFTPEKFDSIELTHV